MKRLLVLCNALDDATRLQRGITTDSPAASRKVFMAARAVARAGVVVTVISQGRGRGTGAGFFPSVARRPGGVLTAYLAFTGRPIISQLISLAAAAVAVQRRARRRGETVLLVYNRAVAYVPAIVVARMNGIRVVLDLEDGPVGSGDTLRDRCALIGWRLFDRLCGGRAVLACSALAAATRLRPTMVYYGVVDDSPAPPRPMNDPVAVLMGGTVAPDTGGDLLAATIVLLRASMANWTRCLTIDVTGKGGSLAALERLAIAPGDPVVRVWGRTTDVEYAALRDRAAVGLALKPNAGPLANSTFPSKVVEMAAAGQLVLTTDISDVRRVLGEDGAFFLHHDTPAALAERLRWIVEHRSEAEAIAARGSQAVARVCDPAVAGQRLAAFLFGDAA